MVHSVGKSQNPQLEISRLGDNVGAIPVITKIKTELKAVMKDDNSQVIIAHTHTHNVLGRSNSSYV